jgi:hypothetical protein
MKIKENPVLDGVCAVKLYELVKLKGQTPKGFSFKLRIGAVKPAILNFQLLKLTFFFQRSSLIIKFVLK